MRSAVFASAAALALASESDVEGRNWDIFKARYGKTFNSAEVEAEHKMMYTHNTRWAYQQNKKNSKLELGETRFADLTQAEFRVAAGLGYKSNMNAGLPHLGEHKHNGEQLAESVDWTESAVTPVKNQGQCGSCWAFSTTGGMEGAWQIATGDLKSMSEQQLVDCSTQNAGCNGGDMGLAFTFAGTTSVATEESYPYKGTDGSCQTGYTEAIPAGGVTGYKTVGQSTEDLKSALNVGPVSVAIEADQLAFQLYKGGVLETHSGFFSSCGDHLDHGVLAVGYTEDAFKVKNSWGASWGESGYIRLSTNGNTCGIHSQATYPVVSASNGPTPPEPEPPTPPAPAPEPEPPTPPAPAPEPEPPTPPEPAPAPEPPTPPEPVPEPTTPPVIV